MKNNPADVILSTRLKEKIKKIDATLMEIEFILDDIKYQKNSLQGCTVIVKEFQPIIDHLKKARMVANNCLTKLGDHSMEKKAVK